MQSGPARSKPRETGQVPGHAAVASPSLSQWLLVQQGTAAAWLADCLRTVANNVRLSISERRLVLAALDIVVLNLALLVTLAIRENLPISWRMIWQVRGYFILSTLVWAVWATFFDCYDLVRTANRSQSAWSAGRAAFFTCVTYLAIPHITPYFPASRLTSLIFTVAAVVFVGAWRIAYASIFTQPVFQRRLLVVGAGHCGRELARMLAGIPVQGNPYAGSGYRMEGFVDDDPDKADSCIEGIPVLGASRDLPRLIREHQIDLIVFAINHPVQVSAELFQALLDCRQCGVEVEPMASVYERLTGRVPAEHARRDFVGVVPPADSPMQHFFAMGKRLTDLLFGLWGLIILALLSPLIALANVILCPGPLFYRQVRVGRGGKHFWVFKFRSMIPAAERECGAVWAAENDCRITPVGRLLRKTRLDELPQFLNVLKGDMSLVGPRPERPEFVARLAKELPFYQARHAVRPGITGWAQVRYRYCSSTEDSLTKLQYDLYYIKHQSIYLEMSILVKTVAVALSLKGR